MSESPQSQSFVQKSYYYPHEIKHIVAKLKAMGANPNSVVIKIWEPNY
jgi:hypothetical protein